MVRAFVLASIAVASILLGWAQPAVAQTRTIDPRWGLFAELAERDFHFAGWGGTKIVQSYRWEDPGRRLSYFFSYVGSDKQVMTLDEATGEIVLSGAATYAKYGDKYGTRLKVAADGTILWPNGRPFLSRGEGDTYLDAVKGVMVETKPGDAASEKVQRLIAAGKLRAANPGLRTTGTVLAQASKANPPAQAVATQSQAVASPFAAPTTGEAPAASAVATRAAVPAPAPVSPQVPTAAATIPSGGTQLPADFPIEWMRGIVLVDDPKGAKVTRANDKVTVGRVFTLIDGKPVTGVTDLVARLLAADPKKVAITTETTSIATTPRYLDLWAEELKYVDGPSGVLITYSAYPGEYGNYLRKINEVEIKQASQVRPILLAITRDLSKFHSLTVASPPPSDTEWVNATLAAAQKESVPADVLQRWGAMAKLPGKLWYCNASDPDAWRQRHLTNRITSLPVARLITAEWLQGTSSMKLTESEGGQVITEVLTAQADGSIALSSSGVTQYANLVGRMAKDGQLWFQMATYEANKMTHTDYLVFGGYGDRPETSIHVYVDGSDLSSGAFCEMEEYDELKLPRLARQLQGSRKDAGDWAAAQRSTDEYTAQLEAEGAQMAANMRASAFSEFAKIPQVVAQVSQQRADLDRLRVAAEEETARNAAAAKAASAAATNPQASAPSRAGSEVASSSSATIARNPATSAPTAQSPSARTGYFACNQMELGAKKEYWSSMFTAPWTFDTAVLDRYAAEFTQYLISRGLASGRRGTCWMDSSPQSLLERNENGKHMAETQAYISTFDVDWRPSSP